MIGRPSTSAPMSVTRRFALKALTGAVLIPLLPSGVSAKRAGNPTFSIRPDGEGGSLVAFDAVTGETRFELAAGFRAADGTRFATSRALDATTNWIEAHDPRNGSLDYRFTVAGGWAMRAISANGRWLAMENPATEAQRTAWTAGGGWRSELAVVDMTTGAIRRQIRLDGNFEVDTVSTSGDSLFLIEHVPAADASRCQVRLYDLAADALDPNVLRDKGPDEEQIMTGYAREGAASANGRHLLTLYMNTESNTAFIHALDLIDRFPVCVDLPSDRSRPEIAKAYAVIMAPSGNHAYAMNPALGVVVEVDLIPGGYPGIGRVTQFTPAGGKGGAMPTRAAIGADGRSLFFSGGGTVWAYDTATATIAGTHAVAAPVMGMGVSADARQVFLVGPTRTVTAMDAATGVAQVLGAG